MRGSAIIILEQYTRFETLESYNLLDIITERERMNLNVLSSAFGLWPSIIQKNHQNMPVLKKHDGEYANIIDYYSSSQYLYVKYFDKETFGYSSTFPNRLAFSTTVTSTVVPHLTSPSTPYGTSGTSTSRAKDFRFAHKFTRFLLLLLFFAYHGIYM
jgi:hypothetical protein